MRAKIMVERMDSWEIQVSPDVCWSGGVSRPFLRVKTIAAVPAVLVGWGERWLWC